LVIHGLFNLLLTKTKRRTWLMKDDAGRADKVVGKDSKRVGETGIF